VSSSKGIDEFLLKLMPVEYSWPRRNGIVVQS
jgi:hypothetical protein